MYKLSKVIYWNLCLTDDDYNFSQSTSHKKCGIIMSFHAAERLSPAMERLYLIITMICITVVSKEYNDYCIIPKKKNNFRNEMTHTFMKLFKAFSSDFN